MIAISRLGRAVKAIQAGNSFPIPAFACSDEFRSRDRRRGGGDKNNAFLIGFEKSPVVAHV
jgi:hypothetical protein